MREKILVTGGAGFIGSHLCKKLAENPNNEVYSLDNYFTGSEKNHKKNVAYIKGSTVDIDKLIKFKPSKIFHLGEYSRVEQSFDDIEKILEFNKIGTIAVVEFCRKHKCKLIYAGSSTKFGDGGLNKSESPYAWSKSSNTEMVINYGKWFNFPYAITYFYNVYGEGEIATGKYATLIALFMEKYKNNEDLTVVAPGTQRRNFTHIEDTIRGLILVGEKGEGDNYGIVCPESFSIMEIAEMFDKDKIKLLPERRGNRMEADVVSEKIIKLGWRAEHSVKDYIEDFKKSLKK